MSGYFGDSGSVVVSRSKSSKQWLKRQQDDPLVALARQQGWRSRAVYKLQELNERFQLISADTKHVVDLGAAPGAWSQYVVAQMSSGGKVTALDLLLVDPLPGVSVIQGDFTESEVLAELEKEIENQRVDLVISDMAPNISGMRSVDQPKSMYLAELALDFAANYLIQGGGFVAKLFQGEGYDQYIQSARQQFAQVRTVKPKASRKESREMYLVAQRFGL